MSIHNNSKAVSERRQVAPFQNFDLAITSGTTGVLCFAPYPCTLDGMAFAAMSVDSTPNLLLTLSRFVVGQGLTTYNLGSTFAVTTFGTSGYMFGGASVGTTLFGGISLPASGSTLLILQAGDVLGYLCGGGSSVGIFGFAGYACIQPMQDSVRHIGAVIS